MKNLYVAIALTAGCSGAAPVDDGSTPMKQQAVDSDSVKTALDELNANESSITEGAWKNGSCGERNYLRLITFNSDGKFEARDEVAPCPEGAECVSSGIIEWSGSWTLEETTIQLSPQTAQESKLPEQVPQSFFVLGRSPLIIAEKTGQLVCPYRKVP